MMALRPASSADVPPCQVVSLMPLLRERAKLDYVQAHLAWKAEPANRHLWVLRMRVLNRIAELNILRGGYDHH